MRAEQCISVTELSKNTSGIVRDIPQSGIRYIFVNNKPQAVILSMEQYEILESGMVEFGILESTNLSPETQDMLERGRALPRTAFSDF